MILNFLGDVPMSERRALERSAINQPALLHVDGIRGCHPCLVGNFHSDGAMLHSSTHHTAAFKFDLSLDGFKTTKHCRVVWRNGNTCGVKFVDKSDARAARAVGSSPTTATFVKLTQGGTDLFA